MAVKGDRTPKENKQLMWGNTKSENKPKNYSWSEDATNPSLGILYQLYYDNDKKGVYLLDVKNDITYQVPYGAKAKGYILAMKLFLKS